LTKKIVQAILDKKGLDVLSVNVSKISGVTDYFIVATGAVDVHLKAVTDNILDTMRAEKVTPLHIEGYENLRWVLIDYIDVVVHLFLPETRKYYSIEKLWGEGKITRYESE